ncbi:MAG: hypothetical protein HOA08_06630 [Rhodospirillaceae bacterium]|jgi:hypothetical protein|nr:hypothetical protein [Rhodospirillaceae bacterium]MBT3491270.1 hypothetical protein [Rhodospirillaceae bacterium]MBT3782728.1 hypothetical protein [Rhodospirillaceae bacterium]MBT3979573.1 hypothetical protein [Rhodospirillaceae bacterium]MBT4168079.1 hypothetical protein [Rhodospirillaceae bacterium]
MSVKQSSGILAIWHDMVPEHEQALNDWYNQEHHAERVAIEGFFTARRHIALDASPKFFIFYETTDPSVLETAAYLACVNNPSSWTQRCMPHYRNTNRLVCGRTAYLGLGHGAAVMTLRFAAGEAGSEAIGAAVQRRAQAALAEPGMVSAQIWQLDAERTHLPSQEKDIRAKSADTMDGAADWTIMLTANLPDQVRAACDKHFPVAGLQANGIADGAPQNGLYQLIFTMGG